MKKILCILSIHLIALNIYPQSGWIIQQGIQGNPPLHDVFFIDQYTGWAAGWIPFPDDESVIIKTTNGGINWFICYSDTSYFYFNNVYFINQQTGWAGGAPGPILKTTNGGENWSPQWSGTSFWTGDIYFINTNTGWAAGDTLNTSGIIIKTTNGGANWFYQNSGTSNWLSSVCFINENTGWICGGFGVFGGIIVKTTNGGTNWFIQYQDTLYNNLYDIHFANQYTGWAFGENLYSYGKVVKTTDGGENWFLAYQCPYRISSLFFINDNTGWLGGNNQVTYNGNILNTTNGGLNWFEQFAEGGPNHEIHSIYFINTTIGWAVGNNGIIISTTNGGNPIGIQIISSEFPGSFVLYQNYPNPFNPNTKIKFNIPPSKGARGMTVRLIVYDILGREIAVLVSENLNTGTYETEWDASNYSSGVYFYKLVTDEYSETKKMVLIR